MFSNGTSLWSATLALIRVCECLMTGTTAPTLESPLQVVENLNQVAPNTIGSVVFLPRGGPLSLWNGTYITGGRSNYDALTVAGNKRLSHGLQFTSSYTFARNLSNVGGYDPTAFGTQSGGMMTDTYDHNLDYGNVAFTHRNRLLATFLYELPFGRKGLVFNKANGWVDGIIRRCNVRRAPVPNRSVLNRHCAGCRSGRQ